jgi:hypothetical protein
MHVCARALAPQWARTEGRTVLVIAEVYLAVIIGLVIGVGGFAGQAAAGAAPSRAAAGGGGARPGHHRLRRRARDLDGVQPAQRRPGRHPGGNRAGRQRRVPDGRRDATVRVIIPSGLAQQRGAGGVFELADLAVQGGALDADLAAPSP